MPFHIAYAGAHERYIASILVVLHNPLMTREKNGLGVNIANRTPPLLAVG